MKAIFLILFLGCTQLLSAQTDTVMMNNRFLTPDPNQLYEIYSVKTVSNDLLFSLGFGVLSTGFMIGANQFFKQADRVNDEQVAQLNIDYGTGMMIWGVATGAASLGFSIAALFDMRKPTTIKPVQAL